MSEAGLQLVATKLNSVGDLLSIFGIVRLLESFKLLLSWRLRAL